MGQVCAMLKPRYHLSTQCVAAIKISQWSQAHKKAATNKGEQQQAPTEKFSKLVGALDTDGKEGSPNLKKGCPNLLNLANKGLTFSRHPLLPLFCYFLPQLLKQILNVEKLN